MSPRLFTLPASEAVTAALTRFWVTLGTELRDARLARNWDVGVLVSRAGVSRSVLYEVEAGRSRSLEAVVRVATALGLRLDPVLMDPRKRPERLKRAADPVHSFMGEFEARGLRVLGYGIGLDEPYQHYQFAGRADLVAWDVKDRALLHIENRTRFPDFQEMAGSFNAKRAYLGRALAARLGFGRWESETHVLAALWSSEVLHAIRLRPDSFRSLCPIRSKSSATGGWADRFRSAPLPRSSSLIRWPSHESGAGLDSTRF
jgi:transcriptional regulator with XRE-family HTH domain